MKASLIKKGIVTLKEQVSPCIYIFTVKEPGISESCSPGEFVNIAVKGKSLRRPFSVFEAGSGFFKILFRVTGSGTRILSSCGEGDELDIMGPLGRGFGEPSAKPLFVSGGVGVAPLYFLSLHSSNPGTFLHGVCSPEEHIGLEPVSAKGHKTVAVSEKSDRCTVVDILDEYIKDAGTVYAAGPKAMMKKTAEISKLNNKKCFVSWEEHMGCGTGLCQSCVVRTLQGYRLTCTDGPVFDAEKIDWDGS